MSREFGSYCSGYLHTQIAQAADDCRQGSNEITKLYAPVFDRLYKIIYSICNLEACDSGAYDPIMKSIEELPKLREELDKIDEYLQPYKDVMREAVCVKESEKK